LLIVAIFPMIHGNTASIAFEPSEDPNPVAFNVVDEDMHNWWAEYDLLMGNYTLIRDASLCTNDNMLQTHLNAIKQKVEKVRFGWNEKRETLKKMEDIMNHEDYNENDVTALLLNEFLAEQNKTAIQEDTNIKQEENDVKDEQDLLDTHPCPSSIDSYGTTGSEWSDCSQECGDGVNTRHRVHEVLAEFNGNDCKGSSQSTRTFCTCNKIEELQPQIQTIADPMAQLYPSIDCTWGDWSAWSTCSQSCDGGVRSRSRTIATEAQNGGSACGGNSDENEQCNTRSCDFGIIFDGPGGGYFEAIKNFQVGMHFNVTMQIKPRTISGVLLAIQGKSTAPSDYMVLQMVDGNLEFTICNWGHSVTTVFEPKDTFSWSDGQWHEIIAVKSTKVVTLSVDDVQTMAKSVKRGDSVDTDTSLYIGGHPRKTLGRMGKGGMAITDTPYVGCIKDIVIRGNPLKIDPGMSREGDVKSGVCPTT